MNLFNSHDITFEKKLIDVCAARDEAVKDIYWIYYSGYVKMELSICVHSKT